MLRGLMLLTAFLWIQTGLCQPKTLTAVKTQQPPVIDGKLTDDAWLHATQATGFTQSYPNYGQPASTLTTVKLLYDDDAVFVAAYLHDDPQLIRKQLTARDGESRQDVDFFSVFFDTYNDEQNGFQFLVTPSNVQTDAKLLPNSDAAYNSFGDKSWDAVWQSQTGVEKDGWVVEMRIPYISLRFAKKEVQTWGLQFLRYTRRNNENMYWNVYNPAQNGFINQFGKCTDLRDIKPPLRLSFSPYVSTGVRYRPVVNNTQQKDWLYNGGMDVKYGINESFTLDATLIPDFGQVISDNLINNLSPFEQKFQENRPFFTEGTELFNKSGLFYSRRIGAIPGKYYDVQSPGSLYTIEENPSVVQLYNAIKFSGRTKNKLGIGVFNAITAPAHARLRNVVTGKDSIVETEPLANYNLVVFDQALKGRSSVTFTNASVIRNGANRDANTSAFDWSLYSKNNKYRVRGTVRYSKIFGFTPYNGNINYVEDTLRMNGRLFLKPYDGFTTALGFGKVSGKIQFVLNANVESNTYDPNDLGYIQSPNEVTYSGNISYNQQTATPKFISYSYNLGFYYGYIYKPFAYNQFELYGTAFWIFKNFWDARVNIGSQPFDQDDYFELRTPNRFLKRPAFHYISSTGSSDSRKKMYVSYTLAYARTEVKNGTYYELGLGLRYRFSNRFSLSLDVSRQDDQTQIGYAFMREANGEPIIGYRRNLAATSILSGIYNFTSRLNITLRTRHYWNQVNYKDFFNVTANGLHTKRAFVSNQDENYNLFNLDAFLTWDFRLGSRVIVGYKNWLGDPYAVQAQPDYFNNLKNIFNASHGNELTVKLIYFLDYNQLRKKR